MLVQWPSVISQANTVRRETIAKSIGAVCSNWIIPINYRTEERPGWQGSIQVVRKQGSVVGRSLCDSTRSLPLLGSEFSGNVFLGNLHHYDQRRVVYPLASFLNLRRNTDSSEISSPSPTVLSIAFSA